MKRPYAPGTPRNWSDVLPNAEHRIAINRAKHAIVRMVDASNHTVDQLKRLQRQRQEREAERQRQERAKRLERPR